MLRIFRLTAILEGISSLLLFIKYFIGIAKKNNNNEEIPSKIAVNLKILSIKIYYI